AGVLVIPAQAQTEEDPRRLSRDMIAAYEKGDLDRAIEIGQKLTAIAPADHDVQYNMACLFALKGEKEKAIEWLQKSADNDFAKLDLVTTDSDLTSIRNEPGYARAVEKIRAAHERSFEKFKPKAAKSEPVIIVPPGIDETKPAPLIVALHGRGVTANSMVTVWADVAQEAGAILVAPSAVLNAGRGYDWGEVDEAEWVVMNALKQVAEQHKIDKERVVLTGFSQGGYMAFNLGVRHPEEFRGVIPVGGAYNRSIASPSFIKTARKPKFYLMVGADDESAESNRRAAKDFEAAGVSVQLKVYEGVAHDFPKERDAELRKALEFIWAK
ncbi:MAG TPA: dienelactone hydrolase family protein, partial [Phycisphaerae bacterium]